MSAMRQWAVQDAKAHFSEVVKKAENEGPQTISVRGKPAVVMISLEEYRMLTQKEKSILDFFRRSQFCGMNLDLERDKSLPREIDFNWEDEE